MKQKLLSLDIVLKNQMIDKELFMFDEKKVKELILATLVADSYSLGAHWIYDEKQLNALEIDWDELNDAKAVWHKGKKAGEFTHFGDQIFWLYQFLKEKNSFDENEYIDYWQRKMSVYEGYIDGATRETLENINDEKLPTGSSSTDFSIIGRIVPLLIVSKSKEEFLQNVSKFVSCTHNSNLALIASNFFARVLLLVLEGMKIEEAMLLIKDDYDTKIQSFIFSGIASKTDDTFDTIRGFGPACDIDGAFQGTIHLLCKYNNLKDMLICNAKAGGDSSARAMVASMIFMAQKNKNLNEIPTSWLNIKATII